MAKIGSTTFLGLILTALLLGPSHGATTSGAGNLAEGRKLAQANCARCHAIGETGASRHQEAPPFRIIAAKGHVDDLQEALAEGIMVGHSDMPEFKLSPGQIGSFLLYLKSLAPSAN